MFFEDLPVKQTLYCILYGLSGTICLIAAVYLLLRRGNAFAADVTPPLRLRRWAASFFIAVTLSHVWWYLFYVSSFKIFSPAHVLTAIIDCATLLTTTAGTLLAMLQDRRRPVWPVLAAMIPFAVLGAAVMASHSDRFIHIGVAYILAIFVLFTIYMLFAARQYGRWLRDNYADLERKEVWLSQLLSFTVMLLLIIYGLGDGNLAISYAMLIIEIIFFALLLWRVETLPQLSLPALAEQATTVAPATDLSGVEQLLAEHCVATQLYLQHDLTLLQLAKALHTNRTYLSQYFSNRGTTYNAYINDLRINHFVSHYREAAAKGQPVTAQQLSSDSGYRSYSTFSLAFKQRMGQSVAAWMRKQTE